MESKSEVDTQEIVTKFIRYTQKNPFFVKAIKNFVEKHHAKFGNDDEHKLEYTGSIR